jgi:filamentous hemagglutinin family protein
MKRAAQGFLNRQYLCVLRRCAWHHALSCFITTTSLLCGSAHAGGIATDGRTQTQLSVRGAVTDITTQTARGASAFNSFHRFNIGNGQTVNLFLPKGTANLLNLVRDERSQLDGVLNAYKDGRIGGHVFFLNPHGIVVGSTGVLNVGNLTMATPTGQFMDSLLSPQGAIDDAALADTLAGRIALTESGLIQVKGRINAAGALNLMAGQIAIDAGAQVVAGPQAAAAFADLVNIDAVAPAAGVEVVNGAIRITSLADTVIAGRVAADGAAGVKAGSVDIHAGGNVMLAAGADVSASGQGAASAGGSVLVFGDHDATLAAGSRIAANGGASGDGGQVELSARDTVIIQGGRLEASAADGTAGSILIDPTDILWTGSALDQFSSGASITVLATQSITLDDVYLSSRKVADVSNNRSGILGALSSGNSGDISLTAPTITLRNGTYLLANADNGYTGGKVTLSAFKSDLVPLLNKAEAITQIDIANSTIKAKTVEIHANSEVKSQYSYGEGKDSVDATAGLATAFAESIGGFVAGLLGVKVVYSDVTTHATINLLSGAHIAADGEVTIRAETLSRAGVAKAVPAVGSLVPTLVPTPLGIGALYVRDDAQSTVNVNAGASIKSNGLSVQAHNNAEMEGSIASGANSKNKSDFFGVAAAVTFADVKAEAHVNQGATLTVANDLTVSATNVGRYANSVESISGPNGTADVAVAYADHRSSANASLGASVGDAKNVSVLAINEVQKDHAEAVAKVGSSELGSILSSIVENRITGPMSGGVQDFFIGKLGLAARSSSIPGSTQKSFRLGGAISYIDSNHTANASIGNDAVVHGSESVAVFSRVRADDIQSLAKAAALSKSAKSDRTDSDTAANAFSVGLALGDYTHEATSTVGARASITAPQIAVYADTITPIRDSLLFGSERSTEAWTRWTGLDTLSKALGSITNIFNVFNGVSSATSTSDGSDGSVNLAGSLSLLEFHDNSHAIVDTGARLNITGGSTLAWSKTLEVQPELKYYYKDEILLRSQRRVEETFNFSAPATVAAAHDATMLFQAGEFLPSGSGEKGLGLSFDFVGLHSVTEAIVREGAVIQGVDETAAGSTLGSRVWTPVATRAAANVDVKATSTERIVSLAASAGYGATFGVNGTYSQMEVDNHTLALIDDEASVRAQNLEVKASSTPVLWSIAGSVNYSQNASVGVGVALDEITGETRAEIADNDTRGIGGVARSSALAVSGATIAVPHLDVEARTSGRMETIAITGAIANNDPSPSGPGLQKVKDTYNGVLDSLAALAKPTTNDSRIPATRARSNATTSKAQEEAKKPPTWSFAGAGSVAVNITEISTVARIDGVTVDQTGARGADLKVLAVADSDITAATGSAAITRSNTAEAKTTVGVSGSVAVNALGNDTQASIENSTIKHATAADALSVQALAGGEQLAVAIAMAVDASTGKNVNSYSVVGSVSLTLALTDDNGDTKNKTTAKISDTTLSSTDTEISRDVDVTAYNRTFIGTGGGSLSVQTSGTSKGGSFGAAVSVANVRNDVTAGIYNSDISRVRDVQVHAYNATEIGAGAAMVAISFSPDATTFSGSVVVNEITNHTTAEIVGSRVTASGDVEVLATDQGADGALETIIDPEGNRNNVVAGLDYCGSSSGGATPSGSCIASVAGVVQLGRGDNLGVSVAFNAINNNLTARVQDSQLTATGGDISVEADSNTSILGIAAGVSVSTEKFSGAGSFASGNIRNVVKAEVLTTDGAAATTLTAADVNVKATDHSTIQSVAGQVSASFKDDAVGGAFAVNSIRNETHATVDDTTVHAANTLDIAASETSTIEALAAAVGGAKGTGVGVSVGINLIGNTTEARATGVTIDDNATALTNNAVTVTATDTSTVETLSGSLGVGRDAGAGAALSINQIGSVLTAQIDDATLAGVATLAITATNKPTIKSIGAAVGVGENGLSGSITLNDVGQSFVGADPNTTTAELKDSTVSASVGAAITVEGHDESTINSIAGAGAFGKNAAIGGAIADNNIQSTATGRISGSSIEDAASVNVTGVNTATIESLSAAGSAATGGSAFAGSASSNRTLNATVAEVTGSDIQDQAARVKVEATNTSVIKALSGGAAFGTQGAGGIAVSVNQIDDTTDARVTGKKAAGLDVSNLIVHAKSTGTLKSLSIGVGASTGSVGVGGSLAINLLGGNTSAYISGGADVVAQHNVGVMAESDDKFTVASGTAGIGLSGAGIGVSFTVNNITSTTKAYIDGASVTGLAKDAGDVLTVFNGGLTGAGVDLGQQVELDNYNSLDLKSLKATETLAGVAINASSSELIENISANVAGGSSAAIGVVVAIDAIGGSTEAYALNADINQDNAGANARQRLAITSSNIAFNNAFVGGISVSGGGAGGAAVDTHGIARSTFAYARNSDITSLGNTRVKAQAVQGISSVGVGGSAGTFAFAGTLSLAIFDNETRAFIDGGEFGRSTVRAGSLDVLADNSNNMWMLTGAVAIGATGAGGGAFAVGSSESTTIAKIEDSTVTTAGAVKVDAVAETDVHHIVVSGAGGGLVGIAGMADVALFTDTTEASIVDSVVGSVGSKAASVHVAASHTIKVDSKAGALGIGISGGGVGAGASVILSKATTTAIVSGSTLYATGAVEVLSDSVTDIDATALTAGGGMYVGIGGAAVVIMVGSDVTGDGTDEVNQGTLSSVGSFTSADRFTDLIDTGDGGPSTISTDDQDDVNAVTQLNLTDRTTGTGGYTFRTAAELSGTNTIVAGSLTVDATDKTDTHTLVGGLGVSLGGGVGGAVAVTTVKANVDALVSAGSSITTTGNVRVHAEAAHDTGPTVDVEAIAGGAGFVGLGAAVAYVTIDNDVDASLAAGNTTTTAGGTVTVSAVDSTDIEASAWGAAAGAYAAGIVASYADKSSLISASIGGTVSAASVSVTADESGQVKALGQSAAAGFTGAGAGAYAEANDGATVQASTDDDASFTLGAGSLSVVATATPQADAEGLGVAVAGGVGIGASVAHATVETTVRSAIGQRNTITAASTTVAAQFQRAGSADSAKTSAVAAGGGVLAGASGTEGIAEYIGSTTSHIGSGTTINGRASVIANTDTRQSSEVTGVAIGGLLALGFNEAEANSNSTTHATTGSNVKVTGNSLTVRAGGTDDNVASTTSGSGGVLAGSAAEANTSTITNTLASVGAGSNTRAVQVTTLTVEADHSSVFNGEVDSINASLAGASGASSDHTVLSSVTAELADDARVMANHVSITADNIVTKAWLGATGVTADDAGWNVLSGSGGLIDVPAGNTETHITQDTTARVGRGAQVHVLAPVSGDGTFVMDARNQITARDKVKLDSGGAIAVAKAASFLYVDRANATASFDAGASVLSDLGSINAGASSQVELDARAVANTYGLAGAPDGAAYAHYTGRNEVVVNTGASLTADDGTVNLSAGRATDGTRSHITAVSKVNTWNKTAIPIPIAPDAQSNIASNAEVQVLGTGSVETSGDISLIADKGALSATATGIGKDIYRETAAAIASGVSNLFGGGDVSFDITGGTTSVTGAAGVRVAGTVATGIHRNESLTLAAGNPPVKTRGVGVLGIEFQKGIAQDIYDRIAKLRALASSYAGTTAEAAYNAEIAFLERKLVDLGLATRDVSGNLIPGTGGGSGISPRAAATTQLSTTQAAVNRVTSDLSTATATKTTAQTTYNTASTNLGYYDARSSALATIVSESAKTTPDATVLSNAKLAAFNAEASIAAASAQVSGYAVQCASATACTPNTTASTSERSLFNTSVFAPAQTSFDTASAKVTVLTDQKASLDGQVTSITTRLAITNPATDGYLSNVAVSGPAADFITVPDIQVDLGSIRVQGDAFTGAGSVRAPGDAKVTITNNTSNYLIVGDITIDSEAARLTFNGTEVNNLADINRLNGSGGTAAFSNVVTGVSNPSLPEVVITSTYDPNNTRVKTGPAPDIQLTGSITNTRGLVQVRSAAGSIVATETSNINAGTVDVLASNGDFVQSYTDNFFHAGGDPAEIYRTRGLTPSTGQLVPQGIVANGSVFISARYLNINGLIQSGIADYQLALPQSGATLTGSAATLGVDQSDIDAYRTRYANGQESSASKTFLNDRGVGVTYDAIGNRLEVSESFALADYNTTQGKARNAGGLYSLVDDYGNIGANYDPANNRYVINGTAVQGGYIQLYGQILNTASPTNGTGTGQLKVLDGYGRIQITNPSGKDIVVANLDAGRGAAGIIDITDIQNVDGNNVARATHTVYTREAGQVKTTTTALNGVTSTSTTSGRTASYSPQAGLAYTYDTGEDRSTTTYYVYDGTSLFGGLVNLGADLTRYQVGLPVVSDSTPLPSGRYLRTGQTGAYHTTLAPVVVSTGTPVTTKTQDYSTCDWWSLCISESYHIEFNIQTPDKTVTSNYLRADNPIGIEFIGADSGLVSVKSAGNVILTGSINNKAGTTTVFAGNSGSGQTAVNKNIVQGSETALVSSAALELQASGSVGTAAGGDSQGAVRIAATGTVNASAANGNVLLDQTLGNLSVGTISAAGNALTGQGRVIIDADGDIAAASGASIIQANRIGLTSEHGAIGSIASPLKINVGYSADLAQRGYYGLEAAAPGDIGIAAQAWSGNTVGHLLVNTVVSAGGDVKLVAPGRIIDNNPIEQIDTRTWEQLKNYWDSVGLRAGTADNADKVERSVQAYDLGKDRDYQQYWQMRNVREVVRGGAFVADAYNPNFRFRLSEERAAALGLSGDARADARTQYEDQQTALYQRAHLEFGSQAYSKTFRYDVQTRDTATYADLTRGSAWTDRELGISVAPGLLKDITNTNPIVKSANAQGRTVTLDAGLGLGETRSAITIATATDPSLLTDAQKVALAAAERSDLDLSDPTQITVLQRKPLNFDAAAALNLSVTAVTRAGTDDGKAYVASLGDAHLGSIVVPGETRIKVRGSIVNLSDVSPVLRTGDLILEAADGAIGSGVAPLRLSLRSQATLIARAAESLSLVESGSFQIDTVYSRGLVTLTAAGSILDAYGNDDLNVLGNTINLTALGGSIGADGNALDVGNNLGGWIRATASQGVYLNAPAGRSFTVAAVTAGTEVQLGADIDMTIDGVVQSPGPVVLDAGGSITLTGAAVVSSSADGVALFAGNAIDLSTGSAVLANTQVQLLAGDDITADGLVDAGEAVYMLAGGSIALTSNALVNAAGGGIGLVANVDVQLDGARVVASAGDILLDAFGSVALTGGRVNAQAGSVALFAVNDIALSGGAVMGLLGVSLESGNDIVMSGASLSSPAAISLIAGTNGAGSVSVGPESSGGYAIDTDSTLDIAAADSITVSGRISTLGDASLYAGSDVQLQGGQIVVTAGNIVLDALGSVSATAGSVNAQAGSVAVFAVNDIALSGGAVTGLLGVSLESGNDIVMSGASLSSPAAISLIAGTSGAGSVSVGAEASGGYAIDTDSTLDITAADNITVSGRIRALGNVVMSSGDDIAFAGGSVSGAQAVSLTAGVDGAGSILGSSTGGTDVFAAGPLSLSAASAIGGASALVAQVGGQATLLSPSIYADVSTSPGGNPLTLSVSDIGGGPATSVVMNVASSTQVLFETFNVAVADITAATPSLRVPDGRITDHAVFNLPGYSTRIDTLSREPHPGFDVTAFTLDGSFSLDGAVDSLSLDSFILSQNDNLRVAGDPPGNATTVTQNLLQSIASFNDAFSGLSLSWSGMFTPKGGGGDRGLVSIDPDALGLNPKPADDSGSDNRNNPKDASDFR